ncbi:MAG: GDSL-type esterase/lipase family protein [Blautia sp.]|jgi:lysophospholipase L1-like esterase
MRRRILCIGDSNTWGYIPGGGGRYEEEERWTGRLADKLGAGYRVIEEGMNGRTTAFSDRIEPGVCALDYLYPCLISHFPLDLIIVMLGTNDCKTRYHVSAAEIGYGMDEVLLEIERICQRKGQHPQILVVSPGHLYADETWTEFDETAVQKAAALGREYEVVTEAHDCAFLDAYPQLEGACIGCDGIHLTREGHRRLAGLIAEKIKSMEGK